MTLRYFFAGVSLLSGVPLSSLAQQSICARVTIQLEQEAAISREAFRATLIINNNSGGFLTDVGVDLLLIDEFGLDGTPFFAGTEMPELFNVTSVDGSGTIDPDESGTAIWTLVPTTDAAPDAPIVYGFGGTLRYATIDYGLVTVPLEPVYLTVHPTPLLEVKYFLERDVYGDDPLTVDVEEPLIPFSLGLQMCNVGRGEARNVDITSSQPEITRNDRGLLIDFRIIGTQVEGQQVMPTLTAALGSIPPDSCRTARWLMTSTLSGHFDRFDATYQHLSELGDERLSLIDSVSTFFTTHAVRTQETGDDAVPDFLVDDDLRLASPRGEPSDVAVPDSVHLSSGDVEPVTAVLDAAVSINPDRTLRVTVPSVPEGWTYIRIVDPLMGGYQLAQVVRADGRVLDAPYNAWQTDRVFPDEGDEHFRLDQIHLFDRGGPGTYTLHFADTAGQPTIETWASLADHDDGDENSFPGVPLVQNGGTARLAESRDGGVETLLATFNRGILPATLTAESLAVSGVGLDGQPIDLSGTSWSTEVAFDRRSALVHFTPPLPDGGRYCIEAVGITDPFGNFITTNSQITVTILAGDITGDGRVNATDIAFVRGLTQGPIDPADAVRVRADVNRDGVIDGADEDRIRELRGRDLRGINDPCSMLASPDDQNPPAVVEIGPWNDTKVPLLDPDAATTRGPRRAEVVRDPTATRRSDPMPTSIPGELWQTSTTGARPGQPDLHRLPNQFAIAATPSEIQEFAPDLVLNAQPGGWTVARVPAHWTGTETEMALQGMASRSWQLSPLLVGPEGQRYAVNAALLVRTDTANLAGVLGDLGVTIWSAEISDDPDSFLRVQLEAGDGWKVVDLAERAARDERVKGAAAELVSLEGSAADLSDDGIVGMDDLALLLNYLAAGDPAGDLNGDGAASPADLRVLIDAMSPLQADSSDD